MGEPWRSNIPTNSLKLLQQLLNWIKIITEFSLVFQLIPMFAADAG